MKILAVDFSSPQRSVAVVDTTADREPRAAAEVIEAGGQQALALGMVEAALREAQVEREQIELIAVGLGPGSYTGIRAAIALAQGWGLARPVKLLGLSSAEVIAAEAQAAGLRGRVAAVIDAQRQEFYLALYDLEAAGPREIEPLRLVTRAQVEVAAGEAAVIGPEVDRWFDGARRIFPRAGTLGKLARERTQFVAGEHLEPIYLRPTTFVKAPPPRIR